MWCIALDLLQVHAPDSILRSKVLLDITVALARGRGLIYARNVQEVAVDF